MRQSRLILLLLTLLVAVSLVSSEVRFTNMVIQTNKNLIATQRNLKAFSQIVGIDIGRLLAKDDVLTSTIINNLERKPNFYNLARANIRLKIGTSGGSGSIIGIEKDGYTYVLTAKHCTPLEGINKKRKRRRYKTLIVEIPMLDKEFDSGRGKDFKIGNQYIDIAIEDIYADEIYDLALFRFPTIEGHNLSVISPAKRRLYIGDTVYAVGNPIAMTDNITKGIFSCSKTFEEIDYMVISSGIIMGNSGGAVANEDGEIVGVVVAISQFIAPRPRTLIYVFHLGMCVPQEIMVNFVLEAHENLAKEKEIPAKTQITN